MSGSQQQQTEQLWRAFKENDSSKRADFRKIRSDLNGSGMNSGIPLHDSHKTSLLLDVTAELVACLTLQQEARVHLMRTFVLSILTPFQVHL